ncbi:unnamed protein product [Paramecium sonneborni]|uniref:EML-like second beta-propeller domain-containing protein n=1 Tax=Paramecium sonneborni TaxID=65129 RepID=A0A8S1RI63_9CILI|nr:unnamed protein product [Paramecium sonneborni]
MDCPFHNKTPHKCQCQRKLCIKCLYDHGVDVKQAIPIDIFQEKAIKKLQESRLTQTSLLTKERMAFKSMLSQTQTILKKIWDDLFESIKKIYDWIEQKNKSYIELINEPNLAESSYAAIDQLVSIVEGTTLNDWNDWNNFYVTELDKIKNQWEQEIKDIVQKSSEGMKPISLLVKILPLYQEYEIYERKEDFYEILDYAQDIDESIYKVIIEILRKEKISDLLGFLSKNFNLKLYESFINKIDKIIYMKKNIEKITNVLRNIQDHPFSKIDYSTETYKEARLELIKKIEGKKEIINFLQFLVQLTKIDEKWIQCGSNGLNLLVGMKVNLRNQSFENIRIKNTSLKGANMVQCNLSGSEFNNVEISGVNLNGASLYNCQWRNIHIDELIKLEGHTSGVNQVCISFDGSKIASGSWDNSIRLWDVKTGQQIAQFYDNRYPVKAVCFSPGATILAFGYDDNSIFLWNIKTKKKQSRFYGHTSSVSALCFSTDGTNLASGSEDKSICLWDVQTGAQKAKLEGHTDVVNSVCFSPDGTTLASGSVDNSILIWDVDTGSQKAKLDGHVNDVNSVCFSPDGTILVSGSADNSICFWDVKTGLQKAKLNGHTSFVQSVCFCPDGTTLASGGADNSIRLWDVKSGSQKAKLDGHTYWVNSVCFSPDGTTLVSGSADNSICLWDVKTGSKNPNLDGHNHWVNSVCFCPDGTTLASGSSDNSISLWDVKSGSQKVNLDGHSGWISSLCFSHDGYILASGSRDQSIRLWDVKTGQQIGQLVQPVCFYSGIKQFSRKKNNKSINLLGTLDGIQKNNLDVDVCSALSILSRNSICSQNPQKEQEKTKLDCHINSVLSVCFSPDDNTLASGCNDKTSTIYIQSIIYSN